MVFSCPECDYVAKKKSELIQHQRTENHWRCCHCDICGAQFTRKANLDRHMQKHDVKNNVHCQECGRAFSRPDSLSRHLLEKHQIGGGGQKRPAEAENETVAKRLKKDDDPRAFYTINKIKEQNMEKFKTTAATYKISFKDIEVTEDVLSTLKKLFTSIFKDLTKDAKPKDLIRMVVQSPSLDYPIVIPIGKLPTLTSDRFMAEIERVLQSNEEFVIDESLIFEVTHVDMPEGGVGKRCKFINTDRFLADKRCIIRIKNDDDLCCARAIVTAKAKIDQHEKWESIRKGGKLQDKLANALHEQADVPIGKCGIEEIKRFQDVLSEYQINMVSKNHFNGIIYKGPESYKKIYLYHHDDHYDVITSMPAFLSRNYYCTKCQKGYDHAEDHKCNNVCHMCRKVHNETIAEWVQCEDCNRFFKGQECFELHKKTTLKGNNTCRNIYRCADCGRTVNKKMSNKPHACGDKYCDVCKDFFPEGHHCYMLPEKTTLEAEPVSIDDELVDEMENAHTYIFFDFECTQDDLVQCEKGYMPDLRGKCQNCYKSICGSYEHNPNLCVAHKICTVCMDKEVETCENCGEREYIFRGENTLDNFCRWLFSEENYQATVLCHNLQGYDSYPILQYLYKHATMPTIIPNGAKIMCLTVPSCKIRMIDSINFLPMALAKLPKMFGFSELKKGYFPHLFNTKENQSVEMDSLPDISYYTPDSMKPEAREEFLTWYEEHKNDRFDFQTELLDYCKSDVDILRRCCFRFREDFMNITGIDPFERSITIASACNLVFRTNFLESETIALIPSHGYTPEHKQSVKALQWIKYLSQVQGHKIQHAKNGGEKTIDPYLVDGYYETDNERVVLEFHGDFWHGNPTKYSRSTVNPVNQLTMGELYDKTLEKQKYLESHGYKYVSIWETEFEEQLENDPHMRAFIDQLDIVTPLEPRDAFYGGRTEAYTLYQEASETEDIDYYDVTSLYPWVNKTGKIPMGHPEIITENFKEIDQYEGLVKCKILPPRRLYHPVLPAKMNGKLLFHLCKMCVENQNQSECCHTDEERAFVGTWVTDEVKKALKKGYEVVQIYEIWHFDNISQYDPETKEGGIFTDYVNTFLKIKQEASGWPEWAKTEDDKQKYIYLYEEKEGIRLDYHKIKKNPGMRALAKLMLNSFWGKFGQRSNMEQVEMVEDPVVYFDKLTSDQEEVTAVNYVSDDMVEMRWKYKHDFVETNKKTNVVIAAYTTAQARLKLYSYLERLGTRALYADTDSVIFTTKIGEWKPDLGDYLGDLTDEVTDNRILTFVTGGPKNYGYKLRKPDETGNIYHFKVRGITLSHKNLLDVNFDTLKRLVMDNPTEKIAVTDKHKITRDRNTAKLLTVSQNKNYKLVFDKRVIKENYVSFPYGY